MIAAADVIGAIPRNMTENSLVKNSSGMSGILTAFSIRRVIAGNIINWIRTVLFFSVSFNCFLNITPALRISDLLFCFKFSSGKFDEHGLKCRFRRVYRLNSSLLYEPADLACRFRIMRERDVSAGL